MNRKEKAQFFDRIPAGRCSVHPSPQKRGYSDNGIQRVCPHPKMHAGYRFYHTHNRAGADLYVGQYTGQVGPVYIELANEPGRYDREVFLVLLSEIGVSFATIDSSSQRCFWLRHSLCSFSKFARA